jgi:maltooligosyltrehalose trehalohydrolase
VAEFPGRFNWGYDGVAPFAPAHVYGTPDAMRAFIDAAHALGIGIILDVVYNHMGPDGCYMRDLAQAYFSSRYRTDWGDAINFDGEHSTHVRAFFLTNVEYWIREFHLDGLRLDATQDIHDAGPRHIIAEMTDRARDAAPHRRVWIIAENEPQDTRLLRATRDGGMGVDAVWNDDFHHSARVALTGRSEAYYTDYRGAPQEFISAARFGYLYQGQHYAWQEGRRGTPGLDLTPRSFVNFLQNHDQVANSINGARIHQLTSPGEYRAMAALLLLMPAHALLFQGQEFGACEPFLFFADHQPALAKTVHAGRREFLRQFPSFATPAAQEQIADPADPDTFLASRLDWAERERNRPLLLLHRDLIRLSREDAVFAAHDAVRLDGAVLGPHAFLLRFSIESGDRLLLVNLGADHDLPVVPEPLLAPPARAAWRLLWSSEDPAYGGRGRISPEIDGHWRVPGRGAVVLTSAASG